MKYQPRHLVALALVLLMAGCSGGGTSSPTAPAAPPATTQSAVYPVTFHIDAPPTSTTAAKLRSAQYISPATTQLMISVFQNGTILTGYPVTAALTPTSTGCSSTLTNLSCQLTVSLAVGSYTATLTALDGSGTALSSGQSLPFTVAATGTNNVALTLSGIPHSLQVSSGGYAMHGSGFSGFTLYGTAAAPVIVTALDADGNIIVGPGAPTYSATLQSGTGWTASTPTTAAPNTISLTPPGTNGSGATYSVKATYTDSTCTQTGAVCSTTFTVSNDIQTLFVANGAGGGITTYKYPYTTPTVATNCGSGAVFSMALDRAGNLYTANSTANTVTECASPYTGAALATVSNGAAPMNSPQSVALDNQNNLFVLYYVVASGNAIIVEYPPPYSNATGVTIATIMPATMPASTLYRWIFLDASNNLYVVDSNAGKISQYVPPYMAAPTTVAVTVSPFALPLLDVSQNLFVPNKTASNVSRYAAPYTGAATTITSSVSTPQGITLDNAGNLFVANGNSTITEYAPPYSAAPLKSIATAANLLAIDGVGNLLVLGNTALSEIVPPYTGTATSISTTVQTGTQSPQSFLLTP
jgi:hypothetical protein